ncbi:MAG: sugar ABC transporter ATP-binding protein [Opitutia bacterium]
MLKLAGISKSFGGLPVLQDVSVAFAAGEVHALMGENGAGKSTLMKVAAGLHAPDAGTMRLKDAAYAPASPHEALLAGVAMIHQELMPIPDMTVGENVLLGIEPCGPLGLVDRAASRERARSLLAELECDISPDAAMGGLSVGQTQVVEIAKALGRNADVLLMDEPTAALSDHEASALFRAVARLKARGVAVVYTTHKMDEVFRLADRITVLRDGRHVITAPARDLDQERLIAHMVGRPMSEVYPPRGKASSEVILEVRGLTRAGAFEDVSFRIRRGEVLGLAGLMGAGRTEVATAVAGHVPADSGRMLLKESDYRPTSPAEALASGVAIVTEDSKGQGIVPALPVRENITLSALASLCRGGVIDRQAEAKAASSGMKEFGVRASGPDQPVGQLSGGNQQKVLLARALLNRPEVVVLDEPTRGIDVGAKAEIYSHIRRLTDEGRAVLLVSSELPEVIALSHRLLVLRQGRVAAELDAAATSQEEVLRHAMPL